MLRVVLVLLVLGFMIYAFVDCVRSDRSEVQLLPRPLWCLVIVLVPLVGAALWLVAGRSKDAPQAPPARPVAPDDDPDFLRRLDQERRRRAAEEERRRRRESGGGPDGDDHSGHPA